MTTALIDASGNIINTMILAEGSDWAPPEGYTVATGDYAIGGTLINGVYTPPAPPAPLPVQTNVVTVSPRQARLAMLAAGLLDQVTAAVNAAGGATQITWEYATEFNRTDPLILSIGASLNLSAAQIDALFAQAATL